MFSQSISLTYKRKSNYKTFYGGTVSSLILFFIFLYGVRLSIIMFTMGATNNSKNTIIKNNNEDYFIERKNFSFGLYVVDKLTGENKYDESFINLTIKQNIDELNSTSGNIESTRVYK